MSPATRAVRRSLASQPFGSADWGTVATTHQKIEQGARSREALLDAAIELIADGGYTATGVDAIAKRSGVVKSALYWHFGSKDGLLVAALERTAREWVAELEAAVVLDAGPNERLENLIQHVRHLFYSPERIRLILSALIERGSENKEVREGVARILSIMRDAIARGMQVLPVAPERIEGLAALALENLLGMFFDYFADPNPDLLERRLKVFRKMLILFVQYELENPTTPAA
jgi:AcrR family transcriptional regulator